MSTTRRKFLAQSSLAMIATPALAILAPVKKEQFVHHVYFWLKPSINEEEINKFEAGIKSLTTIPVVKYYHLGVPATTKREVIDTSYSYSLLLIFDDLENQEVYQKHPIHLKFIDECASLWARVIVYDSVNAKM